MAFCWTLLIGWFAASAINNYVHGKDPYYARSHTQFLESHKQNFSTPVNELFISGEGTMIITILQGKDLTVLSNPRLWGCVYTEMKNGKSMISFTKLKEYLYYEPVTITLPEIPSLSLDNFYEVTVKGLNRKEIHLQCKRVHSFTSGSCMIGTLNLDFPGNMDQQDICINKSNRIDTLLASVMGFGKIRLETIGFKNQISLSDSVYIESTYNLIEQIVKCKMQNVKCKM
jgi:hypothetical protein